MIRDTRYDGTVMFTVCLCVREIARDRVVGVSKTDKTPDASASTSCTRLYLKKQAHHAIGDVVVMLFVAI